MEYYLTPSAKAYYPTPIDQSIWIVGDCAMPKLNCLFMEQTLGKFCSQSEQLNVPVIFVTDEDLGKNVLKDSLTYINEKYLRKSFDSLKALMLPEWVAVPKEMDFSYIKTNIFNSPDKYKLGESESLQNPNFGLSWRINESIVSSDWLGIYQTIGQSRFIFIRIDEIMREPLLNNAVGVASVIIHELGHAIMDPRVPDKLNFRGNVSLFVANLVRNVLEESLANWIAYRCINGSSPYERNVVEFMRTKQSFPYSLGVMFGEAITSKSGMPFGEFRRYIEFWYKAKIGRTIEDVAGWFRLILDETSFTTDDLREQYSTLFNGKKSTKKTVLNTTSHLESYDIAMSSKELDSLNHVELIPKRNTDGKFGYSNSEWVIKPKFDMAYDFSNDVAWVELNKKFGLINKRGEFIVEPTFDDIDSYTSDFSQGEAIVQINNKYGMIDKSGNYVLKPIYDCLDMFQDGLARISTNNGFGFVDKSGKIVIKPMFEFVGFFSEGLAPFIRFTRWGYLDKKGEIVIEPYFSSAGPFINGFAVVELNGKKGYIDTKGKWYDNKPE